MPSRLACEDIEQRLLEEVAVVLGMAPTEVDADIPLHALGIDSMGLVEILVFIEQNFGLNLIESGLNREKLRTLRVLAGHIAENQQEARRT